MQSLSPKLLTYVRKLAQQLPPSVLSTVAEFLFNTPQASDSKRVWVPLLQQLPKPIWRQTLTELLVVWYEDSPRLSGESIATALCSVQHCLKQAEEALKVEVVWTGPEVSRIPVRRTEQVLKQLIRAASEELTLASFALYKVPTITQALIAALERGVQVSIIAETPEGDTSVPFGVEAGLGKEVAARAKVYEWNKAKRPRDKTGRYGSLHMKVAITDRQRLFITSANLTGYAMSLNMEMGLLVNSKALSCQVSDHFDQLIQQKIITLVNQL
ncbi:hypothetical protein S7335_5199 [Synechococcus sp. PCC 7335]|nr:hypothetical protein S7335_5199 [Synechococcus sp. PCC 7335]